MKIRTCFTGAACAAAIVLSLLTECSRNIAGATTETTNGIAGIIRGSDNASTTPTVVRLFPEDYDPVADSAPGASFVDTTDANGAYRFNHIAAGTYAVLARSPDAALSMMVRDVAVTDDSITIVPEEKLGRPGSIAAVFSAGGIAAGSYMYIPGTDIAASIGSDGSALLAGVPAGTISTVILASGEDEQRNVLRNAITIAAGDTAVIDQPQWNYRRRIILNTTPAGADVANDVYNFPVLIRLDGSAFDFSQVRPGGGDLIFTGRNNTVLTAEIERWNPTAGLAEVWVKVDTIRGNDSVQSITMYWGNPDAVPQSTNGGVFDTADGYQGVWHMGEAANDSVRDATVNRYCGGSPDTARPATAEGMIGNCRSFDGQADFITMPNTAAGKLNFPESGQYTVSAWVLLDTLDNKSHCIVSKGYEQYYLRSTYISKSMTSTAPLWEFVEFSETVNWQTSSSPAAGRQWTLLVGVRQGNRQLLYCNGALVNDTFEVWNTAFSRITTNDLYIGRFKDAVSVPPVTAGTGYNHFKGSIDEVRIISAAQSPDWVRLCYMNQRPDDRLVAFR